MTLREARFILPTSGNDGEDLSAMHDDLSHSLATVFGGFTALPMMGGWVDDSGRLYREKGIAYDVALPAGDEAAHTKLRQIAGHYGRRAKQKAIYLRRADGVVTIEDLTAPAVLTVAA